MASASGGGGGSGGGGSRGGQSVGRGPRGGNQGGGNWGGRGSGGGGDWNNGGNQGGYGGGNQGGWGGNGPWENQNQGKGSQKDQLFILLSIAYLYVILRSLYIDSSFLTYLSYTIKEVDGEAKVVKVVIIAVEIGVTTTSAEVISKDMAVVLFAITSTLEEDLHPMVLIWVLVADSLETRDGYHPSVDKVASVLLKSQRVSYVP